jgi:hypothetical protein
MTRISVAFLAVVFWCAGIAPVRADVIYNNGMVNTLSTALGDNALVQDSETNPTTLVIAKGGSVNNATVQGSSNLNLTGPGGDTLVPPGGIVSGNVTLLGNASLNVSGGAAVMGNVSAYGTSSVMVSGGTPDQYLSAGTIRAHDSSTVVFFGAGTSLLFADGDSHLSFNGSGIAISVMAAGNSTVTIPGGAGTRVLFPITATDSAHLTVSGGVAGGASGIFPIQGDFSGSSTVVLDGGFFGRLNVSGSANVILEGGYLPSPSLMEEHTSLSVSPFGKLSIYGTNFNYAYGELPVDAGVLTGTLEDGTLIRDTFTGGRNIYLVAPVPEPASLTLLAIGAAGLLGYVWRRRKQPA